MAYHSSSSDQNNPSQPLSPDTIVSTEPQSHLTKYSIHLLNGADSLIYVIVGLCFFMGSLFALGYSFWHFFLSLEISHFDPGKIGQAIIQFISDLLLVLIITEVLGTVIHYLKARATSLRPFLFIGIISATRGILSIGARLSIEGPAVSPLEFNNAMIELGVNGLVILVLGITIKLLGSYIDDR